MPEKDVPKTISRIFGLGRNLRAKLPKSLSKKSPLSPRQERGAKIALLMGLSLLLALILAPRITEPMGKYQVGDVARENVKATGGFLVEDVQTRAKKQQELMTQMPPVFDLQEQLGDQVQQRLQKAMDFMRRISQEAVPPPKEGLVKSKPAVPYKVLLEHKPNSIISWESPSPNPPFTSWPKPNFHPTWKP